MKKALAVLLSFILAVPVFTVTASANLGNVAYALDVTFEGAVVNDVYGSASSITDGIVSNGLDHSKLCFFKAANKNDNTVYITFEPFDEKITIVEAELTFGVDNDLGVYIPLEPWLEAKINGQWRKVASFDLEVRNLDSGIYTCSLYTPFYISAFSVTSAQYRVGMYVNSWASVSEIKLFEGEPSKDNVTDTMPSLPTEHKIYAVSAEIISGQGVPVISTRNGSLIDGLIAPYDDMDNWYDHGFWYAFKNDENINTNVIDLDEDGVADYYEGIAVIDLGAVYDIEKIIVNHAGGNLDGVGFIWGIFASYSTDGVNWVDDPVYANQDDAINDRTGLQGNVVVHSYDTFATTHTPEENYTARYVKVNMSYMEGGWALVSEITVYGTPAITGFTITDVDTETPFVGTADQLSYAFPSENTSDVIAWHSDNEEIAIVDENGMVSFLSTGAVTITATTDSGLTDSVTFTVGEYFIAGDANDDGKLAAADYLVMKRIVFSLMSLEDLVAPETALGRCDISGDGKVTATDYLKLKRAIFTA